MMGLASVMNIMQDVDDEVLFLHTFGVEYVNVYLKLQNLWYIAC